MALEGDDLALNAIVGGQPVPYVHWQKDDSTVLLGLGISSTSQEHSHSLIIPNSMMEDTGVYKVTAENYLGEDSKLINVDIQGTLLDKHLVCMLRF